MCIGNILAGKRQHLSSSKSSFVQYDVTISSMVLYLTKDYINKTKIKKYKRNKAENKIPSLPVETGS